MIDTDIDGAKPKKVKEMAIRDNFNVADIAGAKPKPVHMRNTVHDQKYEDVSKVKRFEKAEPYNPLEGFASIDGAKPRI